MATEFVSTVMPSGGDYSTLSSWEAAIDCNLTTAKTGTWITQIGVDIADGAAVTWDLGLSSGTLLHMSTTAKSGANSYLIVVAAGTLDNLDIVSDGTNTFVVSGAPDSVQATAKIDGTWSASDTTLVVVGGWTTGVSNHIKIYTTTQARHTGTYSTSTAYSLVCGNYATAFDTGNVWITVDGLQVSQGGSQNTGQHTWISHYNSTDPSQYYSNNIVRGASNTRRMSMNASSNSGDNPNIYIWNCNIRTGTGVQILGGSGGGNAYVYSNSFQACGTAIGIGSSNVYIKNNLCTANTTDYSGTPNSASTYNLTDDTPSAVICFGVTADSGICDATTASKLVDSDQNFTTTCKVGMVIKNTTDTTYTYITAIDSDGTLSVNDDIFADTEAYTIYTNMFGTPTFTTFPHLDAADTVAKDKGANLYDDPDNYLDIITDIDGEARPNSATTFDIGADEYVVVGGGWATGARVLNVI